MDRYDGGPANGISGDTPGLDACDGGGRRGWRVEDEEEVEYRACGTSNIPIVAVKSRLSTTGLHELSNITFLRTGDPVSYHSALHDFTQPPAVLCTQPHPIAYRKVQ